MLDRPNIFHVIASRDLELFIKIVDEAFKEAAREASCRSHAMGLKVADGRVDEERRPKPVTSSYK
jgi:hypothetical protein